MGEGGFVCPHVAEFKFKPFMFGVSLLSPSVGIIGVVGGALQDDGIKLGTNKRSGSNRS